MQPKSGSASIHAVLEKLQVAGDANLNELDDYTSAWEQCKKEGQALGGRGSGGRGVNRGLSMHSTQRDAVVHQLTPAYDGKGLLHETRLVLAHGHRYGLIGRNGVGKTTLLRRMAAGSITSLYGPRTSLSHMSSRRFWVVQ